MKATIVLPDKAIVAGGVGWYAVELIARAWFPSTDAEAWACGGLEEQLTVTRWPDHMRHASVFRIEAPEGLVPAARVLQSALMFAAAGRTFSEQAAGARALIAAGQALAGAADPHIGWDDPSKGATAQERAVSLALHRLWRSLRLEAWDIAFAPNVVEYAVWCENRAHVATMS